MPSRTFRSTLGIGAIVPWLLVALLTSACGGTPAPTTPAPTVTPQPTPTAGPSATPTASAALGRVTAACLQGIDQPEGKYSSYILASVTLDSPQPSRLLLLVDGANDNLAAELSFDQAASAWQGHLGMSELGPKRIDRLFAIYADGSGADITTSLFDQVGGVFIEFQRADEAFGTCDV